jgi:CxxC motif-containing protein
VGDTVKIAGHGAEVVQTISSMQIDKAAIEKAKKGDDVAIKVDQPVKAGDEVSLA